jgi:hypothetical protein
MKLDDFQHACIVFAQHCVAQARLQPSHETQSIGEWSFEELVTHLVMVNMMCSSSLEGKGPETLPPAQDVIGDNLYDALKRTTEMFTATFALAVDKAKPCPTPIGEYPAWVVQTQGSLEHLIHACDLQRTFGLLVQPPEALVAEAATRILQNVQLFDMFRSMGMYSEPVIASPDCSSIDRLLAYLGRHDQ